MGRNQFKLVLLCQDYQFHVHRALVAHNCPVIAAALRHPFKEAITGKIEVNFDPVILQGMLEFIYRRSSAVRLEVYQPTQTYTYKVLFKGEIVPSIQATQEAQPALADGSQQNAQSQPMAKPPNKTRPTRTEVIFYYARLNGIADYYDIKQLGEITFNKLYNLFRHEWSIDDFWLLVQELDNITGDRRLRQYLSNIGKFHAADGLTDEDFDELRSLII
ncbi:hypothetical protein F4678DRAFT_467543 [Xylaria arbuscula]|nr:hypothetical protein F4678DRAFT_467543 [Xylaria arbuscula]